MNPEAAGGVQAQPGGVTGAIFVERGDGLCFAQQIQGKLHPGEQRVGGRGKSREQFKGALQYSFACLCWEVNEEAVWELTAVLLHCGIC